MSQAESAARIEMENFLKMSSNSACVRTGIKSWNRLRHQVFCFSYSDPAHQPNHASLHTWESKGGCWSGPSATAPYGVQLQSLINWMLRFHVGNPREFHHLRLKGVRWRHQRLPRITGAQKMQNICFPECTKLSSASWQNSRSAAVSTTALNVHNRHRLTLSWHGKQHRWGYLFSIFSRSDRACVCSKSFHARCPHTGLRQDRCLRITPHRAQRAVWRDL